MRTLTHVDQNNLPTMVDVTDKTVTTRVAMASAKVQLPIEMRQFISGDEIHLKKGPVFQTAIVAGTMATKKTHEMIPFCHQIPVESCKFEISVDAELCVTILCKVKTTFKTGVEMEALHGATVAALTVYDMCKAVSHNIVISETKLLSKTGGKRTVLSAPLYGLVLTGGRSTRMKRDKALLSYNGKPHALFAFDLLHNYCAEVYLSARKHQWLGTDLEDVPTIEDLYENEGPMSGLLSAFNKYPNANWLVVACDLPYLNAETVEKLLSHFNKDTVATCFKNSAKGFPEPLCTLYTPLAKSVFTKAFEAGQRCPTDVLKNSKCELIDAVGSINLANINTPAELAEVQNEIG